MIAVFSLLIAFVALGIGILLYIDTIPSVRKSISSMKNEEDIDSIEDANNNINSLDEEDIDSIEDDINSLDDYAKSTREKAEENEKDIDSIEDDINSIRTTLDTPTFTDEQITTIKKLADITDEQITTLKKLADTTIIKSNPHNGRTYLVFNLEGSETDSPDGYVLLKNTNGIIVGQKGDWNNYTPDNGFRIHKNSDGKHMYLRAYDNREQYGASNFYNSSGTAAF